MKNFNWTPEIPNHSTRGWNLRTMYDIFEKMDNPHLKLENKVIHVAGTNGKGSTVNFIRTILEEASFKVGMYTSPHLVEYNERMYANGRYITDKEINKYKQEIIKKYKKSQEISYFEITTAIAIMFFANFKPKLDYYIFEVGLGGRLDATNIFQKPLVSVITSISFDHMDKLGNSLEKIAREKGGIIKSNVPVFTSNTDNKIVAELQKIANVKNAKLSCQNRDYQLDYNLKPSLLGEHQQQNATLAKEVCKFLGIKDAFIKSGVAKTKWKGRLELVFNGEDKKKADIGHYDDDNDKIKCDKKPQHIIQKHNNADIRHNNDNNIYRSVEKYQHFFLVHCCRGLCPSKIYLDGAHNEDGIRVMCEFVKQTRMDFENEKRKKENCKSFSEKKKKKQEEKEESELYEEEKYNSKIREDNKLETTTNDKKRNNNGNKDNEKKHKGYGYKKCNIIGIFACLKRKDYKSFFPILKTANFDKILFFDVPKTVNDFVEPEELQKLATSYGINSDKITSFREINKYYNADKKNIIFIFGSLYFIGWVQSKMNK